MLPQLLASVAGSGAQVALVGEVEISAGAETAMASYVNDAKRGEAQQFISQTQLVSLAEVDATHACKQEDERVDVAGSGTISFAESGDFSAACGQRAQEIVHHTDARRLQVALQGYIRHQSVLAVVPDGE